MQADFKIFPENSLHRLIITMYEMDETPLKSKGDRHDQPDDFQFRLPTARHHLCRRLLQDIP